MKQPLTFLTLALAGTLTIARAAAPEFFAMDTGTRDATHQTAGQQVALVREVGFAGIAPIYHNPQLLRDTLAALDQRKLKIFAVYVPLDLDSPAPVSPAIRDVIEQLRGRNAFLWLYVNFTAHKPSDSAGDAKAVPVLREVADLAKQAGVRVSLYPHLTNWVERVEDGARLAKQVDRENFGVTFNLCHWLMVGDTHLDASLRAALPHLQMVTINGADAGNKELKACIQPLGSGNFDVGAVLTKLAGLGWNGPIGLQHFGIQGDAKTNLQRSMDAWRNLSREAWPLSLKLEVVSTLPAIPWFAWANREKGPMTIWINESSDAEPGLAAPATSLTVQGAQPATGEQESAVQSQVEWPAFIARHDMIWDTLPGDFDCGAFLGNGMLGATIYQDGGNRLRFEMGRADVTEHRRDNARLPIGGLVLTTTGKIESGTMRLDLWNAEVRGSIKTDKGSVTFHCFIHSSKMVMVADMETTAGENAAWSWDARPCVDRAPGRFAGDPPNPPNRLETDGKVSVCVQPRAAGGEFATAWTEVPNPNGQCHIVALSIADSFPGNSAKHTAVESVRKASDQLAPGSFHVFQQSHRDWWHAFYPKNLVSIPDPKLESFYWIQWYKLASASRPDSVPVDLLGPWFRKTGWPRIWWNLNIETLYLPVYTGNRLELGESFVNFIDKKRDSFFRNGKEIWKFDDCATVPHTTDYEGLRGDGDCAPDHFVNPGDFTWALHNYYLHYRYTMDHTMITDQTKHAFYPLLKGCVNLYLKILKMGEDGKLHMPDLMSPEYGRALDTNYNLGLLRWSCQTLIDLNQRYRLKDPMAPTWEQTLKDLVPYPVDENGLSVGAGMPFKNPHRHWSHILMVHPLHIMTADNPSDRELLNKSVLHWLKTGDTSTTGDGIFGWSRAAAASLYATLGDGENAIKQIHGHMADKRFVRSNTMYIEGDPVIECSIVLNRSLQDMLLQSWGDKIHVFSAIPAAWKDAVFHDLRTEGAFLVSANRKDGTTEWVRIKSLAGEPCRVQAAFASEPKLQVNGKFVPLKPAVNGAYELPLVKGDEALLLTGGQPTPVVVKPVPIAPEDCNPFGG